MADAYITLCSFIWGIPVSFQQLVYAAHLFMIMSTLGYCDYKIAAIIKSYLEGNPEKLGFVFDQVLKFAFNMLAKLKCLGSSADLVKALTEHILQFQDDLRQLQPILISLLKTRTVTVPQYFYLMNMVLRKPRSEWLSSVVSNAMIAQAQNTPISNSILIQSVTPESDQIHLDRAQILSTSLIKGLGASYGNTNSSYGNNNGNNNGKNRSNNNNSFSSNNYRRNNSNNAHANQGKGKSQYKGKNGHIWKKLETLLNQTSLTNITIPEFRKQEFCVFLNVYGSCKKGKNCSFHDLCCACQKAGHGLKNCVSKI